MTYRIEFSYRGKNRWEQGYIHRDFEAESPSEAIDKLMNLETPDGKFKDCCLVWSVDIWQKVERPKDGWVEADNPKKF